MIPGDPAPEWASAFVGKVISYYNRNSSSWMTSIVVYVDAMPRPTKSGQTVLRIWGHHPEDDRTMPGCHVGTIYVDDKDTVLILNEDSFS